MIRLARADDRPLARAPRRGLRCAAVWAAPLVFLLLGARPVSAQVPAPAVDAGPADKPAPRPSDAFALNGDVRIDNTIGLGTLTPGESRRPSYDVGLFLRAGVVLGHGFSVGALQTVTKNLVTYAESGASRPYDTLFGDTLLTASWLPQTVDAGGKRVAWLLPGRVRLSLSLMAALPVSRASRFQTRWLALTPGFSLNKPDLLGGKLGLLFAFGLMKNFNRLTTTAVPAAAFPALARPDGPEFQSGQTEIATGTLNTAFAARTTLSLSWLPTPRLAVALTYILFNNFRYDPMPDDALASIHAKAGRGRSDLQWGLVTVAYTFDPDQKWTLSGMALTAAPPWSADNRTLRFPFLDFRSAADNYSSLSLSLGRAF